MEQWKDIPWYEWIYQVSSLWNVQSYPREWPGWRKYFRKHKPCAAWIWYNQVHLTINKKSKSFLVHRLVAAAFLWLDLQNKKMFVCYKNDIRNDNRLDNLFLWTHKDNILDCKNKWRLCLVRDRKPIYQFSKDKIFLKKWESQKEAEKILGIHQTCFSHCLNWKQETAWWFIWRRSSSFYS